MKIKFKHVCLVGVGLIGGSLSRDLLGQGIAGTVAGFDVDRKNLRYAVKNKIISQAGHDLSQTLKTADLVILATPVITLEEQIVKLSKLISPKSLVIDVGSTKERIVKLADCFYPEGNFVGCHPMAGSENSGAAASVSGLFKDWPCLIVPGKRTRKSFLLRAKGLWQALGARVYEWDGAEHDRYLAACSHLPHVLGYALLRAVGERMPPKVLGKIAGRSFKSYTRVAGSDARMWADIFLANQKNVLAKIRVFKRELERLEKRIAGARGASLLGYLEETAALWREIKM